MIINFTKAVLDNQPLPERSRLCLKDLKVPTLLLYITPNGAKSFYTRKRLNGKDQRFFIGTYPEISIEQARKQAQHFSGLTAIGKDPVAARKRAKKNSQTFGELFTIYMERYSKPQKRSWKYDEREVNRFLSHWFKRRLVDISRPDIKEIHDKTCAENGLYQANRLLERISAMFNKAIEWGWEGTNPAQGIKKFREKSRDRFIQAEELPRFFEALAAEQNQTIRDYIWLSLWTGARKTNVLQMRWDEINLVAAEWRIPVTKNGEALTVPLVEQAADILLRRKEAQACHKASEWVFPSETSIMGHLADPKRGWSRILKRADIKNLRVHDLRRTLGSYQAIEGASLHLIGKSLGHKSQQATQVYARFNLDPVRRSLEAATSRMISLSGLHADGGSHNEQ